MIGTLTDGSGPPLVLVHGGMGMIERWLPVWDALRANFRVTAMDRRGRGSSTDGAEYSGDRESADIRLVIEDVFAREGAPVNVFAHSIGATFALAAVAGASPVDRVVLYEPAGPETVAGGWPQKVSALIEDGRVGQAIGSFLTEVIGMSPEDVERLRRQPGSFDPRPIAAATFPREARALEVADLGVARAIDRPVLLLLGSESPPWASTIVRFLQVTMPEASVALLAGCGHEGIDDAPALVGETVTRFLTS